MFEIIPFEEAHLHVLKEEEKNRFLENWLTNGRGKELAGDWSFTGLVNGEIMVIGGLTPYWAGRAHLWSVFSQKSKYHFVTVFRGIKKFLHQQPFERVELAVPVDHEIAHRRAKLLGFHLECQFAQKYLSNGDSQSIYAFIKEGG